VSTGIDGTNSIAVGDVGREKQKEVILISGKEAYLGVEQAVTGLHDTPLRIGPLPITPEALALCDIDGDAIYDLVVAGEHAGGLQFLRGDNAGGLSPFK
jgi:hypothetical protein